jgi:hypothetical protein
MPVTVRLPVVIPVDKEERAEFRPVDRADTFDEYVLRAVETDVPLTFSELNPVESDPIPVETDDNPT